MNAPQKPRTARSNPQNTQNTRNSEPSHLPFRVFSVFRGCFFGCPLPFRVFSVFCGYFFGCALVLAAFGSAAADPRFADPKTWLQGLSNQWNATSPAPTNVPPTNAAPLTSDLRPPTSAPPASGSNTNAFSTMDTLDDKHKLALGDRLSFRIVEDQEDPRETLAPKPPVPVTDSGDVEVPYIGRFPAVGKTCKQLAREIRTELEKKYYYQATVIIALDLVTRSGGRVYLVGQVRASGPVEIPGDEVFTLSKAILRAGGFTEYANQRHVKVTRNGRDAANKTQTFIVNMNEVFEKGKTESDMKLEPGDLIFVPRRLVIF